MANEELQRRSRRVRIFWIVAAAALVIAIVGIDAPDIRRRISRSRSRRCPGRGRGRGPHADARGVRRERAGDGPRVASRRSSRAIRSRAGAVVARMSRAAAGFLDTRSDLQARAAVTAAEAQFAPPAADWRSRSASIAATWNSCSEAHLDVRGRSERGASRCSARFTRRCEAEVERARSALLDAGRTDERHGRCQRVRAPAACCVFRRKARPSIAGRARRSSRSAIRILLRSSRSFCRRMPCA